MRKQIAATVLLILFFICVFIMLPGNSAAADSPPDLPTVAKEVVNLSRGGMGEDVLLNYVKTREAIPALTSDQVSYLTQQGVSQTVIAALRAKPLDASATGAANDPPSSGLQISSPAPGVARVTAPPGAPAGEHPPDPDEVNFSYFQAELGPYGEWVEINSEGSCWVPAVLNVKPDWRPFVDEGEWKYTDKGWYWSSEYPWGEIVFHYGRWFQHATYRWAWKPGIEWTPAPVDWMKGPNNRIQPVALRPADPNPPPANAPTPEDLAKATGKPINETPVPVDAVRVSSTVQITFNYFYNQLSPFGTWVEVPGIGWCWSPHEIAANPDWRPYNDSGQWVDTENGLFWASDYKWGDIPFHYGRWIQDTQRGWLWVPGYNWGPAWVAWRDADADGSIGWAPLPYDAVWIDGGWRFHGGAIVDASFDFGLGAGFFVFVGYDHFHERFPHRLRGHDGLYRGWVIPRDRMRQFYGRSVARNEFSHGRDGRLVNHGIGHERMKQITQNRVQHAALNERNPIGNRDHPGAVPGQKNQVSNTYKPPSNPRKPQQMPGARTVAGTKSGGGNSKSKK
jgi:hypothetical protein